MSSWSATAYPPPPRRSRSRSPYRGASYAPRPPFPDAPPDPYRTDWEAYDRDRAWANYDRERGTYDYGRRGRSRSPGDEGRKRRRSASPWERDRYERPRYDDYDSHRGHGGHSPRRGQYPSRHAPPDPHTFDYPASLKQYAEWFRYFYPQQATEEDNADKAAEHEAGDGSKPRNGIRSKWEKYKKEFASHQLQRMFEHHRKSPWFAEKYDPAPEHVRLRRRLRREGWKGRLGIFLNDLESGVYDPNFNEPSEPEPVKEGTFNGVSSENIDIGPAIAEDVKPSTAGDDEMPNADAEEETGEQDGSRTETNGKGARDSKPNNRGEEVSVMPEGNQVMIRTIPPDIGRLRLEEACGKIPGYVYLALGDPLQKRNFYRAGWLKFEEDADMTAVMTELSDKKIEGFKLHVTHNNKPFTNRIRYAPEVASKPERLVKDLANARTLAALLEDESERLKKPLPEEKPAATDGAEEGANGPESSAPHEDAVMSEPEPQPQAEAEPDDDGEPKEKGSEAVERRIENIMNDLGESGAIDINDEKELEEKRVAISLDLYISYLRAAFNTCFYCAVVTDHVEELQRKCVKHVRKPMSRAMIEELRAATSAAEGEKEAREKKVDIKEEEKSGSVAEDGENDDQDMVEEKPKEAQKEKDAEPVTKDRGNDTRDWKRNDERWLDWFDAKIALLINRDGVDPRDYGGKDYDDELTKNTEPFIKQEDEGKFRCKNCQKLFKATSFVEKHVANKHPEQVRFLQDIPYFNNFALDPHRIQPFSHAPPVIGNSQQPPPQAYGLQGPAYPPAGEYGRMPPPFYGGYGQGYPPYPPPPGGYYDHRDPHAYGAHAQPLPRHDRGDSRRLSDRITGFANDSGDGAGLPMAPGLPAKPIGVDSGPGGRRGSGGRGVSGNGGPLPPPPPNAKEDPRAAAGKKVSYHDMDLVAEGDVELNY